MGVHGATDQILRSDEIERDQGSVVVDRILKSFREPVMSRHEGIWFKQLGQQLLTESAAALAGSDTI